MWVEGVIGLACVIGLMGASYFIGREEGRRSMRTDADMLEKTMRENLSLRIELKRRQNEAKEEHYLTD